MDEIGDPTVACERLLAAVDRLRGERDTLRRSLEFVRMEHKFAVESLEKKLSASLTQSQTIVTPPHPSPMLLRSQRATLVFALVVQHLYSTCDAYQTQVYYLADNLEEARNNLETAEQVSAERVEVIMELEADADAMQDKLGDSEARFVEAESQIQALHARILTLEQERDRERAAHEEAGVSLTHAEAQLTEVTKSLENVESERDSLGLRVTHLEQDLETAQNEVEEVEARYHQLQSQQLSSMSSSEATRALRSQIEELEGRVLRRTEQIGIHQHDIKRLETNSRLQEDRITEMAGELEELRSEKEALLDDCRTTREERGEAMRKCEDLEEAIEVLEERNAVIARQRDVEMHSMVGVVFQGAATRRSLSHAFTSSLARRALKESSLNGKLRESEDYVDRMSMQHTRIRSEHECALRLVEEKDALLKSIDEERQSAIGKAEGTSSVLSALESQLRDKTSELEVSKHDRDSVQVQLEQLRDHLRSKVDELSTLQAHYDALQTSGTQALASDRVHFTQQIKQLEERCDSLQGANLALESKLEQATQELNQAKEELVVSVSDGVERALAEQTLHAELENLRSKYEEDTQKLQDEISHTRVELEDIQRQRADLKATHSEELERATQSRSVIETRLAEAQEKLFSYESLQRDHQDLQERHSLDVNELRQQLTRTEQDLENAAVNHDELIARHQNAVENLQQQLDEATTSLQARATLELEFSDMKTQHADQVRSLEARIEAADQQTQELRKVRADLELRCVQLEEHTTTSSELETRLSRTTAEVGELQAQLRSKAEEHARAEKEFIAEMKAVTNRSERAELSQTQLQEEVARVQVLLEEATTAVQTLQEERQNLQEEMTALGAEVQRSLSLQRHQESRLNEGERELTALKEQLERARSDYVLAEKAGKSAEINLSLQTVQNEKLVSSLRKELAALRESSKLEGTVAELKEQNAEMEELLRAKCLEIEDNDDRFIELLKEKKKLTSKIDSLTRKVNTLQSRLAATTNSASDAPSLVPSQPAVSHQLPPPPPPPTFTKSTITPLAVPSFMPGPSHSRPKTPEPRLPPPPVFKARTPEAKRAPPKPLRDHPAVPQPSTSAGKKRRAPDDFEDCEGIPPQGFTADCAPSHQTENTPRIRRALLAARSGFTPSRGGFSEASHSAAPTSPTRRATTGPPPPIIADVTNSPKSKKGWLGKMRGASAQVPQRSASSIRPVVFERMQNGYSR